jgi:hypothetical protein
MSSHNPLPKTPITRNELIQTNVAMLVLTSLFVLTRVAVRVSKRKNFELPDFFIYFAYILYVALWSVNIVQPMETYTLTPSLKELLHCCHTTTVQGVRCGRPRSPALRNVDGRRRAHVTTPYCWTNVFLHVALCSEAILVNTILQVVGGVAYHLPKNMVGNYGILCLGWSPYTIRIAECPTLIDSQSWIGSVFSSIFTCDNLNEKFQKGKCGGTPNEDQRIIFSLYFAYAVDVATDLASTLTLYSRVMQHLLTLSSHVSSHTLDMESANAKSPKSRRICSLR